MQAVTQPFTVNRLVAQEFGVIKVTVQGTIITSLINYNTELFTLKAPYQGPLM